MADALQMWFGYNLTPDMAQQKMMIWIGTGRNGKGALSRVLMQLIGESNYCSLTFSSLSNDFSKHQMVGKLAAILTDAQMGRETDAVLVLEFLKAVVGGDPVDINRKNRDWLTGLFLTTRFTILTNENPRLPDASTAIGKRIILLPFHQDYSGREDPTIEDRMGAELPGILNWAIEGLRMLKDRGRFTQPECGADLRAELDAGSSPVHSFVNECCEVDPSYIEDKELLRAAINFYLVDHGHKPLSSPTVTNKLRAVNSRFAPQRQRIEGARTQLYSGLRLTAAAKFETRSRGGDSNHPLGS
jgi:putative DNA primase/helicase